MAQNPMASCFKTKRTERERSQSVLKERRTNGNRMRAWDPTKAPPRTFRGHSAWLSMIILMLARKKPGARLSWDKETYAEIKQSFTQKIFNNDKFYIFQKLEASRCDSRSLSLYTNENAIVRTKRHSEIAYQLTCSSHFHKKIMFLKNNIKSSVYTVATTKAFTKKEKTNISQCKFRSVFVKWVYRPISRASWYSCSSQNPSAWF